MSGPQFTSVAGDSLRKQVLTDTEGNPTSLLDTDGQAIIVVRNRNYVWDVNSLSWVKMVQPSAGGGVSSHVIVDSGSVAATQSGTWNVGVTNFPASQGVTSFPATTSTKSGQSLAVTVGATVTIVSYTTSGTMGVWGWAGSGTADGLFTLSINSSIVARARINAGVNNFSRPFLPGLAVGGAILVAVAVTNTGMGTGDFEGEFYVG